MWLAVNKNGNEVVFKNKPIRWWRSVWIVDEGADDVIEMPTGTIKKLIGKELTWKDEPYKYI